MNDTDTLEVEQERRQRIDELAAQQGSNWQEQYRPGSSGCHELLDRVSLIADLVESSILSHPACAQFPEWFVLANRATDALQQLYQQIGAVHLDDAVDHFNGV